VTWTFNDGNGNISTQTQNIVVNDTTAPAVNCKPKTVYLNASGNAGIVPADVYLSGSDNCGTVNLVSVTPNSFTCANLGANSVTLTVNDGHGNVNTCTATVTVTDNTPPTVTCKPKTLYLDTTGNASIVPGDVYLSGSDNCGTVNLVSVVPNSFTCANLGANSVILTVNDGHGNVSTCTANVTVNSRATTLVYQGPIQAYFADCVNVKAKLTDTTLGSGVAGQTIVFTICGPNPSTTIVATGTATTAADGTAATTITLSNTALPGAYTVKASFAGQCPFLPSNDSDPFTINTALAGPLAGQACYTGNRFFWTTGPTSSTATLALSATIRDVSDVCASDIRLARVTFAKRNSNGTYTPITGASNLPVGLVDPTNKKVGTASAIVQYNIGSLDAEEFKIAVIVTGAYQFNNPADDRIIGVAKPLPGGFIFGVGEVANGTTDSSGYVAGASDLNTLFGFDVKYNKSLTNPQGKLWVTVFSYRKADGTADTVLHTYDIKSTSIAVLATTPATGVASFSSKANITDVTNPASPIGLEGGAQLQVDLFDGGTTATDKIGITLFRKAGGVWFALKWDGAKTVKKDIVAGSEVSVK
jgi:hypothetical protein